MSRDLWVNRCRQRVTSRFLLAQAAVLRWEQLLRGALPRVPTEHPKGMETPLRELATGAVTVDHDRFQVELVGTPYEPPRREVADDILEDELEAADVAASPAPEAAPAAESPAERSVSEGDAA